MYEGLIEEQIDRINKARDGTEGYDYYSSVESLGMLLPCSLEDKALQYTQTHKVDTKENIDLWYSYIRELMEKEGLHVIDRHIRQLQRECELLYANNMLLMGQIIQQYKGFKHG